MEKAAALATAAGSAAVGSGVAAAAEGLAAGLEAADLAVEAPEAEMEAGSEAAAVRAAFDEDSASFWLSATHAAAHRPSHSQAGTRSPQSSARPTPGNEPLHNVARAARARVPAAPPCGRCPATGASECRLCVPPKCGLVRRGSVRFEASGEQPMLRPAQAAPPRHAAHDAGIDQMRRKHDAVLRTGKGSTAHQLNRRNAGSQHRRAQSLSQHRNAPPEVDDHVRGNAQTSGRGKPSG